MTTLAPVGVLNKYDAIKPTLKQITEMTADEIITLAKLPSRETLIAMLAGGLLGTISKLAVALNEVKAQKENA